MSCHSLQENASMPWKNYRCHSMQTSVSPVQTITLVANTATIQLDDTYEYWRLYFPSITIDPYATITLIFDGFTNTSNDLVLERNLYKVSPNIALIVTSLETHISAKSGNPAAWDLTFSNTGTPITDGSLYLSIKRVRV